MAMITKRWAPAGGEHHADPEPAAAKPGSGKRRAALREDADGAAGAEGEPAEANGAGDEPAHRPKRKRRADIIREAANSDMEDDVGEKLREFKAEDRGAGGAKAKANEQVSLKRKEKTKVKKKKGKKGRKQAPPVARTRDPKEFENYLGNWAKEKDGEVKGCWKPKKKIEVLLFKQLWDAEKVSKDVFDLLLRYMEGVKGAARQRLRDDAGALIALDGAPLRQQEGTAAEGDEQDEEAEAGVRKVRLKRAKRVLKALDSSEPDGGADATIDME